MWIVNETIQKTSIDAIIDIMSPIKILCFVMYLVHWFPSHDESKFDENLNLSNAQNYVYFFAFYYFNANKAGI